MSGRPHVVIRTEGRSDCHVYPGDSVNFGRLPVDRDIVARATEQDGRLILTVEGANRKSMTIEAAMKICEIIPHTAFSHGDGRCDDSIATSLRAAFPEYTWRVFLNRAGERTRWSLTALPDGMEPREHYVERGRDCICCGKSLAELRAMGLDISERGYD